MTETEVALIVAATALGALVKGITGLGYPLIAVPLITLLSGVESAVVIVAGPNLIANVYLCWDTRATRSEVRDLRRILAGGVVGTAIGTAALVSLPETPILVFLVATILAYVYRFLRTPHLRLDPDMTRRWSPVAGMAMGAAQGSVGVSGPVVVTWLHGYRLRSEAYVFAMTLIFAVTGAAQLVLLVGNGSFTSERLMSIAITIVPLFVFLRLGRVLRCRLDGPAFERAVLVVLVLAAVSLVVRIAG